MTVTSSARRTARLLIGSLILLCSTAGFSQSPVGFLPEGTYDPAVPTPRSILGFEPGERAARYDEVVTYLTALAARSPRMKLAEMGTTYEGRSLYCIVFTSPENMARLAEIRTGNSVLADPRSGEQEQMRRLVRENPVIVWGGYAIHGGEISSTDAALQLAYQLAAGTDTLTLRILRDAVFCMDPVTNPDGRERFLSQMQQWNGPIPNPDAQSVHHTGTWPGGRGSHYLFDLNRDWFILSHPEMQSRVRTVAGWNPQVMIDSHEMGSSDTYLFSPPRQPLNPNISPVAYKWWGRFASDQAKAFDRFGWSYYTREWNDDWYPGYGASWPLYTGAVGILYEQAGVQGSLVKRADGTVLTYREAVHHHFTSTMANLATAARNREEILADFTADRRIGVPTRANEPASYYLVPGANRTRLDRLVERLLISGIEVAEMGSEAVVSSLQTPAGDRFNRKRLPKGTIVVSLKQPLGRLVKALLEFDPRMRTDVLAEERKSLEKAGESKMYDVTAWSLPLTFGLEAYASEDPPPGDVRPLRQVPVPHGRVENAEASYGYLMRCADDREVEALASLLQQGYRVRAAKENFAIEGASFERGTILIRRSENPASLSQAVKAAAESCGVTIRGVGTALATSGVDLGGNDMVLLKTPRIALIGGPEVSSGNMGWIWHLLEQQIRLRASILMVQQLNYADLGKYNIMILPSGNPQSYARTLGKNGLARLRTWVEGGGTLIAEDGAAAFVADTASGLSAVRLRQQALKDLALYRAGLDVELRASEPRIDSTLFWSVKGSPVDSVDTKGAPAPDIRILGLQDERARMFAPQGAILKVLLDREHWLAFGAGETLNALVATSNAFMSRGPVQTPARFAEGSDLRLSGLLWPEARERLARTAFATREQLGRGQIILFAGEPAFRRGVPCTERLLLNAILFGPGFGTSHSAEW